MKRLMVALLAARSAASLAQAVMLVFVARFLTPAEFGSLSALLGIGALLSVALDFGVSAFMLRRRQKPSTDDVAGIAVGVSLGGAMLLFVLLAIAEALGAFPLLPLNAALLIAFWLAVDRFAEFQTVLLISEGRDGWVTAIISIRRVLPLVGFLAATAAGASALQSFALALIGGAALSVLLACRKLPIPVRWGNSFVSRSRKLLCETIPFWFGSMSTQVREAEPWLFQITYGPITAGFYSVAYRFWKPFQVVAASLGQSITPTATREGPQKVGRYLDRVILMGFALSIGSLPIIPLVPLLLELLLGRAYTEAAVLVQITIGASGLMSVSQPLSGLCQALYLERPVAIIGWVSVGIALAAVLMGMTMGTTPEYVVLAIVIVYSLKSLVLYGLGRWKASR